MNFNAPDIDYAGISPIIALTAGICAVLVGGVLSERHQRLVVSVLSLTDARRRRRALHLAVGTRARTWSPGRCGSTTSGSRAG